MAEALADTLSANGLRLDGRLHAGRLTEVWRAVSREGAVVAVKTPAAPWSGHRGARLWLEREHRALGRLAHPRIVRAIDFLERDGCVALVTEYLGGGDLVPLAGAAPAFWLDAAAGVAEALAHVHERGYVH
ncbi:MAG TPA: protein kinase, partial [Gammaproteobacteria bacterium]|nr:protein kinase [Gammaproteobacteria bacterium]